MKRCSLILVFALLLFVCGNALAYGYGIQSGARATLNQQISARSGPGKSYASLGSYGDAGSEVTVLTGSWNSRTSTWWVQVEVSSHGKLRRVYTEGDRINIDAGSLPQEHSISSGTVSEETAAYYGPGSSYSQYDFNLPAGTPVTVYCYENGYAQVDCKTEDGQTRRLWISQNAL